MFANLPMTVSFGNSGILLIVVKLYKVEGNLESSEHGTIYNLRKPYNI